MSRGVNLVILIGNLGADVELKYTPSGAAVANVNIAVSESWNDKDGNKQERTEWCRLVFWSKLAEIAGQYLRKGSKVYVEGKLQTRSWDDKDGNKRQTTEVHVRQMQMLDGKTEQPNISQGDDSDTRPFPGAPGPGYADDDGIDLPF